MFVHLKVRHYVRMIRNRLDLSLAEAVIRPVDADLIIDHVIPLTHFFRLKLTPMRCSHPLVQERLDRLGGGYDHPYVAPTGGMVSKTTYSFMDSLDMVLMGAFEACFMVINVNAMVQRILLHRRPIEELAPPNILGVLPPGTGFGEYVPTDLWGEDDMDQQDDSSVELVKENKAAHGPESPSDYCFDP
ncbi:hypothetical protein BSKO_02686 [Bryopsis sp. KO-2023]|nr:hypothetical protein BSKO_02686 [Bryopsis sp. KO-2023]